MANCRRQQTEIRELRHVSEELKKDQDGLRDKIVQAERKCAVASNEAEEARTFHEMAERQKRQLEQDLDSLKESLQDAMSQNQCISNAKRGLESEMATIR